MQWSKVQRIRKKKKDIRKQPWTWALELCELGLLLFRRVSLERSIHKKMSWFLPSDPCNKRDYLLIPHVLPLVGQPQIPYAIKRWSEAAGKRRTSRCNHHLKQEITNKNFAGGCVKVITDWWFDEPLYNKIIMNDMRLKVTIIFMKA